MGPTLILTLAIVALAVLLLGVRVFFTRHWGFPNTHVDGNPALEAKGLSCHRHQHQEAQHRQNLFDKIASEEL